MESAVSFDTLSLEQPCLDALTQYGFCKMSPVQQKAIPPLLQGESISLLSSFGTGKVSTYLISFCNHVRKYERRKREHHASKLFFLCCWKHQKDSVLKWLSKDVVRLIIERMEMREKRPMMLWLGPSREMAYNVEAAFRQMTGLKSGILVGGTEWRKDRDLLRGETLDGVFGTPGRVNDMALRGELKLDRVTMFVAEEADTLEDMGYADILKDVAAALKRPLQCVVGCAAARPVTDMAEGEELLHVRHVTEEPVLDGCRQYYVDVSREEWKVDTLVDLVAEVEVKGAVLVYCNTRRKVDWLWQQLLHRDVAAVAYVSDGETQRSWRLFTEGSHSVALTTDLASRQLDTSGIRLFVHFDVVRNVENYIHRCGTRSRIRQRMSILFVTDEDKPLCREIEKFFHCQIDELPAQFKDFL